MNSIKALSVGLVVAAVSFAQSVNISGTVTDTGGVVIAGAIVTLENGGLADTTESDGSFTLTDDASGISNQINRVLSQNLSAAIHNGLLCVNVAKMSVVEITAFDLSGKALSKVQQIMDAGIHSLSLPWTGNGICLYKVKSGKNELALKSTSHGGISHGTAALAQGSSSLNALAKQQRLAGEAINDVIAVTKSGYLNYRVVACNSDTTGIHIKMITSAGTVTDADGNVYQTVMIGNQVWTVENLRVTKYTDGSAIPLDTLDSTWNFSQTPKYCFYENMTDADSIRKYGALYNWFVVNPANPKKIAPTGWHVPSDAEWDTLQNYLVAKGYNWDNTTTGSKIGASLAAKTDWLTCVPSGTVAGAIGFDLTKNNSCGFSALPAGIRYFYGTFFSQSSSCFWWSTTEYGASYAYYRALFYVNDNLRRNFDFRSGGYSIRLVKD